MAGGCASTKIGMFEGEESCTTDAGTTYTRCDTGAVAVIDEKSGEDLALIDRANSRTKARRANVRTAAVTPDRLGKRYGALIGGVPKSPRPFTLYFKFDSDDLVDGSDELLDRIFAEIANRPGADVQIVGHTDTMGPAEGVNGNDELSRQRAEVVRQILERRGLAAGTAYATGRGERDAIDEPTRDEFASARNRRVEVIVK